MSVSGLSSSTLQLLLQQMNSGTQGDGSSTSSSSTSAAQNLVNALKSNNQTTTASQDALSSKSSPAYVLSSSQKQYQSQLLSYSSLGKLVGSTESSLDQLVQSGSQGLALDGRGKPLSSSVSVTVNQLAQAQTLTSGSFASADQSVLGTGTLTLSLGDGTSKQISIGDGSLNGVAKAINDASAGIGVKVVQNSDGSYHLEITGSQTGKAHSFGISGIPDLLYDPTSGSGALQETTAAQDATYTVNGSAEKTSATNDNITVAPGIVTSFTKTGQQQVSNSVGQAQATSTAQEFIGDFNSLLQGLPSSEDATGKSTPSTVGDVLAQVANQKFNYGTTQKSLADIGVTVGSDGSLSLDQTKLQAAYNSDPNLVNSLVTEAARQLKDALSTKGGVSDHVTSSVHTLVSQLVHIPTLADYLSGNANSSGSISSQLLSGGGVSA